MKEYETGAIREDKTGKGRCDLLPMCALIRLSKHFERGSEDHGESFRERLIMKAVSKQERSQHRETGAVFKSTEDD